MSSWDPENYDEGLEVLLDKTDMKMEASTSIHVKEKAHINAFDNQNNREGNKLNKVFLSPFERYGWTHMPCPSTGPKMFCGGLNFLSQSKNLIAFSASSKTFVPAQKPISLNSNHLLFWHKMFVTGTICK